MLITPKPNFIVPVFQEFINVDPVAFIIQYKPFASFYQWSDFIDLTPIIVEIATIDQNAQDAQTTADNAQTIATAALANAATAATIGEDAQETADEALALATSGGGGRRATMWADEFHYLNGTPIVLVNDAYLGNFVRYTDTNNAEFTTSFVSGEISNGGIYLLGVRGSSSGIVEVRIDGNLIGSSDLYNATTQNNYLSLVNIGSGNPTIAAGYHKLSVKVNGKFVSSTGYAAAFTKIYIRSNAD